MTIETIGKQQTRLNDRACQSKAGYASTCASQVLREHNEAVLGALQYGALCEATFSSRPGTRIIDNIKGLSWDHVNSMAYRLASLREDL